MRKGAVLGGRSSDARQRSSVAAGKGPLWATAFLAYPQGDYTRMAELATEGLGVARQGGDPLNLRNALTVVGPVAMCEDPHARDLEPFRQSLDICRGLGKTWQLGTSYLNLGNALLHSGQPTEAEGHL